MNTTRRNFLRAAGGIIAAGVVRSSFAADPEGAPPAKPPAMFSGPIESRKLEEGFNVLIGGGGNTTVLFDAGHLLVIDSGMPHRGEDLLKLAMQLSPQAVTKALFNTHWHFDHVGGNGAFVAAGFTAIGTTACRTRLGQRILLEDMGLTPPYGLWWGLPSRRARAALDDAAAPAFSAKGATPPNEWPPSPLG